MNRSLFLSLSAAALLIVQPNVQAEEKRFSLGVNAGTGGIGVVGVINFCPMAGTGIRYRASVYKTVIFIQPTLPSPVFGLFCCTLTTADTLNSVIALSLAA